jgi:hypothetical protein
VRNFQTSWTSEQELRAGELVPLSLMELVIYNFRLPLHGLETLSKNRPTFFCNFFVLMQRIWILFPGAILWTEKLYNGRIILSLKLAEITRITKASIRLLCVTHSVTTFHISVKMEIATDTTHTKQQAKNVWQKLSHKLLQTKWVIG